MAFPDTVPSGFTHKPAQVTPMSAPLSAPWALPCLSSSQLALDLVLGLRRFVGIPLFSHHFLKSPNGLPLLPPGLALQRLLSTEAGPQPRLSRAAPTGLPRHPCSPSCSCLAWLLCSHPAQQTTTIFTRHLPFHLPQTAILQKAKMPTFMEHLMHMPDTLLGLFVCFSNIFSSFNSSPGTYEASVASSI